ncbi:DcaP family trimeric outer membrane transporter [Flammeovirga pacifica]|nr:DcaP family trimeric outer membrane transporter [Flammeovirga pacifica]
MILLFFSLFLSNFASAQWMRTDVDRVTYLRSGGNYNSPILMRIEPGRDILTLPLDSTSQYVRAWDYLSGKRGYIARKDIQIVDILVKGILKADTTDHNSSREEAILRVENEAALPLIVEIDNHAYDLRAYESIKLNLKPGNHGFWSTTDGAFPFWGELRLPAHSENILQIDIQDSVIIAQIEPVVHQRDTVVLEQHHNEVVSFKEIVKVDTTKIVEQYHPQDIAQASTLVGIRGYVKMNALVDFNGLTATGGFAPYNITVGEGNNQVGYHMDARQSRIAWSSRIETDEGFIRFYVESDFAGGGTGINNFRLRHAYVSYGYLTVGQTWTTFNDLATTPLTVDNEGPSSGSSTRQGLIRYEKKIANTENEFGFSIETPTKAFTDSIAIDRRQFIPDFAGRYKWVKNNLQLQAASLLRFISSYDVTETVVTDVGYGVMLSGLFDINIDDTRNHIYVQAIGGKGITRYISAFSRYQLDAVPNPEGDLYIPYTVGGYIALEHYLKKNLFINFVSGFSWIDNAEFQPGDTFERSYYTSLNLFWFPFDRMRIGSSIVHGERFNKDQQRGSAQRLQMYIRYDI